MSTVEEAPTYSEAKYSIYERGKTEELISERTIRIKGNSVDIKGYDPRLSNQLDNFHRFPQLLDEIIVDNQFLYGVHGNSTMYVAPGTMQFGGNIHHGFYTIGINNETGIIYHICFYDANKFTEGFHFP